MKKIESVFSKSAVDKAGRQLAFGNAKNLSTEEAQEIVAHWRSCHEYPMFRARQNLKNRANKITKEAIVVQRHKREISIISKLRRQSIRLTQMQDIGGCRAIVPRLSDVREIESLYKDYHDKDDRISAPAASGYRSLHIVERVPVSKEPSSTEFLIEIQLRTLLQHSWATAIETVDTFLGTDIKSSNAPAEWLRLFALISGAFALQERTEPPPGVPSEIGVLKKEIEELDADLNLLVQLRGWSQVARVMHDDGIRIKKHVLLSLDAKTRNITIKSFSAQNFDKAYAEFVELDRASERDPSLRSVLVSADSIKKLKIAYPNFYIDTSRFFQLMSYVLSRSV